MLWRSNAILFPPASPFEEEKFHEIFSQVNRVITRVYIYGCVLRSEEVCFDMISIRLFDDAISDNRKEETE